MRNLFNFKKLSWKIACIVGITVVVFAGGVAAYMEYRIISEINRYSDLYLRDSVKNGGVFLETGENTARLTPQDRASLIDAAAANRDSVFDVQFGDVSYLAASSALDNGFELYIAVPESEVTAEIRASVIKFIVIFAIGLCLVLLVANQVGKSIAKPLKRLADLVSDVARGNINVNIDRTKGQRRYGPPASIDGGHQGILTQYLKDYQDY